MAVESGDAWRRLAEDLGAPEPVARALVDAGYRSAEAVRRERSFELEAAVPAYREWRASLVVQPPASPGPQPPRALPDADEGSRIRAFAGAPRARAGASVGSLLALGVVLAAVGGVVAVALQTLDAPEAPQSEDVIEFYCHPTPGCSGPSFRADAPARGIALDVDADFDGTARAIADGAEAARWEFERGAGTWRLRAPIGEAYSDWRLVIDPAPGHEGEVRILSHAWLDA